MSIDAQSLKSLDLSGAWALHEFLRRTREGGAEVTFQGTAPEQLRLLDETLKETDAAAIPPEATVAPRAARRGPRAACSRA